MRRVMLSAAFMAALLSGPISEAALIEEFLFDDSAGTSLGSVANSVPGGHAWADDIQGDFAGTGTNGLGQYSFAAKANNELGTALVNNAPDITAGTVYGVIELTWDFDTASLNTAENEEIRLTIINLNTAGSSSVTAELAIVRQDDLSVTIAGSAVGGSAIAGVPISATQSAKFISVVGVNLDSDIYSIYFSDDAGASFTALEGGTIDAGRIGAQLRMVVNNDVSQDDVLVDRVALYTHNPFPGMIPGVPEPATVGLLACGLMGLLGVRRRV